MSEPEFPLVGRGWTFPPRWDAQGSVAMSSDERDLKEAIEIILLTTPGTRRMRPEFGVGADDYVFAPNTADTKFRLAHHVERGLRRFEPRIIVESVTADDAGPAGERIDVEVVFRMDHHRRPSSLVVPFYLESAPPEAIQP